MSETVFKQVNYDLHSLVKYIELGEIGLPDIQRPFVWKNTKVRDLFDSMYRGYPVGYLLFWQNAISNDARFIGTDLKQKPSRMLIVDGQQRLTSLYAVLKQVAVVRENYSSEQIKIAFNPVEEKFDVLDAAINRDKSYIPDISVLWRGDTDLFDVVENYLSELRQSREVISDDERKIKKAISRLQGLIHYPFTALELHANITEEDVADVFVRINSKGTPLNQADFILTLMSVYWDEGRFQLEEFCRQARFPSTDKPSPFNPFIQPDPDQLLRVGVGLGFKRARLKHVYSLLRGTDLDTNQFSDDRRLAQFEALKNAQERVLNLQYWKDFLHCIRTAGFRHASQISSRNNIIFAYILYLIGRTEYKVEEFALRKSIACWFFMAGITGRYAGATETTMEADLASLRRVTSAEGFLNTLSAACELVLTEDYWNITLPQSLATSSSTSPSASAIGAALALLDAPVLYSNMRVADLFDPDSQGKRKSTERHHLFPKNYLVSSGITDRNDINQIANYAFVEWGDNVKINDRSPSEYVPELEARFSGTQIAKMYEFHALPSDWTKMAYEDFLVKRRKLLAKIIRNGYETLSKPPTTQSQAYKTVYEYISDGESHEVEFKSTLRTNLHTNSRDAKMEHAVLKTIAAFLNTNGGVLTIGVTDDGTPIGIEKDGFENEDKMSLHLINLVKDRIGPTIVPFVHLRYEDFDGARVLVVETSKSPSPVFVKDMNIERFYIRTGPSTTELSASQIQNFIRQRFN